MNDSTVINRPPISVTAKRGMLSKKPQSSTTVTISCGNTVWDAEPKPAAFIMVEIKPLLPFCWSLFHSHDPTAKSLLFRFQTTATAWLFLFRLQISQGNSLTGSFSTLFADFARRVTRTIFFCLPASCTDYFTYDYKPISIFYIFRLFW